MPIFGAYNLKDWNVVQIHKGIKITGKAKLLA
jgi:hypothetical protein